MVESEWIMAKLPCKIKLTARVQELSFHEWGVQVGDKSEVRLLTATLLFSFPSFSICHPSSHWLEGAHNCLPSQSDHMSLFNPDDGIFAESSLRILLCKSLCLLNFRALKGIPDYPLFVALCWESISLTVTSSHGYHLGPVTVNGIANSLSVAHT